MALAALFTSSAQGHALIEKHIITYYRGLSYNNAHTMVYEESFPYLGARMYLNACPKTADSLISFPN